MFNHDYVAAEQRAQWAEEEASRLREELEAANRRIADLEELLRPFAETYTADDEGQKPLRETLERLGLDSPTVQNCRDSKDALDR